MTVAARRGVLALALAIGVVLAGALPAFAHASLEQSDPAPGAVLDVSPSSVTLRFSEAVGIPERALAVYDENGEVITIGTPGHSGGSASTITASLPPLADGLYVVSWRAVSADSHPVDGAFTFTVGPASSADPVAVLRSIADAQRGDPVVAAAAGAARVVEFVALALLVGAMVIPGLCGLSVAGRRLDLIRSLSALTAAAASAAALVLSVPLSSGGSLAGAKDVQAWNALLDTTAGRAALVRTSLLVVVAVVTVVAQRPSRVVRRTVLAFLAAAIFASALAGHGGSGRWIAAGFVLTVLHTTAMAVWLGGLVVVLAAARPSGDAVRRFSRVAAMCVGTLVVTGVAQSVRQLERSSRLGSTTYGRWLLFKVVAFVAMIGVAALSRRVTRRTPADQEPARTLRRRVLAEVAIGVVVLVATSALMVANPTESGSAAAGVDREAGDDAVLVSLFVEPARAGSNQVHLGLRTTDFSQHQFEEVTLRASLPGRDIGPFDLTLTANGYNHWLATAQLPFPGHWRLTVAVLISEFDRRTFTFDVGVH